MRVRQRSATRVDGIADRLTSASDQRSRTQNSSNLNCDDDAFGVLTRNPIAPGVTVLGIGDVGALGENGTRALECEPSRAVDLAHRSVSAARGVERLLRLSAGDDPHDRAVRIPCESDRDNMRRAVGAQGGQGCQVAVGEELQRFGRQRGRCDGGGGHVDTIVGETVGVTGTDDDNTVLLLGGRSEIGMEIAVRLAPGRTVVLAARRSDELSAQVARLRNAGARAIETVEFDADDVASHDRVLTEVAGDHGPLGTVILAFGILGDQKLAESDAAHAVAVVHTDFVAQVSVLTHAANLLRAQGTGRLVVFSSVAGVRVRKANYVYGSAKAGLDGFASGLSDALHGSSVSLLLVRPGFVIGSMTAGMTPAPFSSTPDQVADAVVGALARGRARVWVPGVLAPIYFALHMLPQWLWRKLPR